MTVTDDLLANNAQYAETFTGPLPLPPAKHVAVARLHGRAPQRLRRRSGSPRARRT